MEEEKEEKEKEEGKAGERGGGAALRIMDGGKGKRTREMRKYF